MAIESATILFTDVVGSTELSQRLSAEAFDEVRRGHFSILRQAIAETGGTEVKNLGDGLMVVFGSASAAMACAVAMQQAVEQGNRRSAHDLGLRIGMSCGEVTTEDDDYFGDPVVEAARVCALCEGGQILVTDAVRAMARRRNPHSFTVLGDRELKGLPDPVVVCTVGWQPSTAFSGIPLPERLEVSTTGISGFLGRQTELERLTEAVKDATGGGRRVVFLSGEPGIGKTSLCRQVAEYANELGVSVLYGRCDEDLGQSYQPFAEALSHLVIHADDKLLTSHVAEHGGELAGLVPAVRQRIPDTPEMRGADANTERFRLFNAVVGLLRVASEDTGLLLVLDDLHWADRASLQLMRHVAESAGLVRVMMLGTYRDSELFASHPLSDTLASLRRADVDRIHMVGLEDVEIVEMTERVAGHELEQTAVDLAHAVRRETDGNPFFAIEILRHLGETGLVHQDASGRWVPDADLHTMDLPQSVREVVGQRVDRLGEKVRRVLSQASIIGREFDIDLLAKVAEVDEDSLLDLVDQATEAGLVSEVEGVVDRFSFAHSLIQHTLYEDLGASRRARQHRKIAEALEQLCGEAREARAGELAHHFFAATKTADAMKALSYSKLAGEQALARLAPADALVWFTQALELYPQLPREPGLHCDLLTGLGTAQRLVGDLGHRETLIMAAEIGPRSGRC